MASDNQVKRAKTKILILTHRSDTIEKMTRPSISCFIEQESAINNVYQQQQRQKRMRTFGTRGPVDPAKHYVVQRTDEIADFINRVKDGRYIVIFAPRQTGKTTFFYHALDALATEDETYFPIQLDFEEYKNRFTSRFLQLPL